MVTHYFIRRNVNRGVACHSGYRRDEKFREITDL